MADAMKIEILGLGELQSDLNRLAAKGQRGVVRKALRKGAQVILREAKSRVPVRTGLTKRSLGISATVNQKGAQAEVGSRRRAAGGRAKIIHIIEKQHPFLVPAFEAKRGEAVSAFGDAMKAEIEQVSGKVRLG